MARLSFTILVVAGVLLAGHQLVGQTPPPVQPKPATGSPSGPSTPPPPATAPAAGGQAPAAPAPAKPPAPPPPPGSALLAPPPPIGIPPEELPRFEVASVKKPSGRGPMAMALRTPGGGRITIVNLPLRTILMQAFGGLRDYQISGAPGWMATERFTINAKAETNAPRNDVMLMLRAVLVDRFQLEYHVEKREMQAYVLTTAEKEWKPTARMKPVDCTAGRGAPPPPPGPIRPDQVCGGMTMLSTSGITSRGITMTNFANMLSSLGGLGVVHDRTGLTGTYYIELDASPTALLRSMALTSTLNPSSPDNLLPAVGDGRSLGSAVSDLGLKLDRQREPVEVLVIDSVGQPDED